MQQTTEIITHKMAPSVVTKFKVVETITKEKMMSFNQLSKKPEGIEAYHTYVKENEKKGEDITQARHFKLCSKSKKDVVKCKSVTRKRITKRKAAPPKNKTVSKTKTKSNKKAKKNNTRSSRTTQKSKSKTSQNINGNSVGFGNSGAMATPPVKDRRVTISPRELSALNKLLASDEQSSSSIATNNANPKGRRKTISPQQLAAIKKLLESEKQSKTVKNVKMRSPNPRRKARNVLNPKYYGNMWVK
jgi:hypothetical protein